MATAAPSQQPAAPHFRSGAFRVALAVLGVLVAGALLWMWLRPGNAPPRDPAVRAEWQSSSTPVLQQNGTTVVYQDLGDRVSLTITVDANPILWVDVNGNHQQDAGDVVYVVGDRDEVCVRRPVDATHADCAQGTTGVTARTGHDDQNVKRVTWTLPKAELTTHPDHADLVIELFDERTQLGEFLPQATADTNRFAHVYRLAFSSESPAPSDGKRQPKAEPSPQSPPRAEAIPPHPVPATGGAGATPVERNGAVPSIDIFEALPDSSRPGEVRLRWKVSAATSVTIDHGIGAVAGEGERQITAQDGTPYLLTARSDTRSVERQLVVSGPPPAPRIVSFTSDTQEISPGATAVLSWSVEGSPARVAIDPLGAGMTASGSRQVSPGLTTEYVLTAERAGASATRTVTVRVRPSGPPAVTLEATPAETASGGAVVLRWAVGGADRVTLDNGIGQVAAAGSTTLHPVTSGHYTLTASGKGGTTTRDVGIVVTRPTGPSRGRMVWTGSVHGVQLVTITRDSADTGLLEGALPGQACILQLSSDKNVSLASTPGPRNDFERLVLRVKGEGQVRVVIDWVLQ